MKTIDIKDKLEQIDVTIEAINLGDFDFIGELCAKRQRPKDNPDYAKRGAFYRANYERGILLYYLIRKFSLRSILEIGTARGFNTLCAARALRDEGVEGKIVTIDPAIEKQYVDMLGQTFPADWFKLIQFIKATSEVALKNIEGNFDVVIVGGDTSYEGIQKDWNLVKDRWNKFVIIDTPENEGSLTAVEEIDNKNKELIITDRRLYPDDRPPVPVNKPPRIYGQTLISAVDVYDDLEW